MAAFTCLLPCNRLRLFSQSTLPISIFQFLLLFFFSEDMHLFYFRSGNAASLHGF